jgi:methyl-accepting chemotaxis protein
VIDEIAFQSNLLALSAAVEAGLDLAQRSTQAAKDTAAMIQKSIDVNRGQ